MNTRKLLKNQERKHEKAEPGQKIDLGGGAILTVLAPNEPFFTKDQMKAGGNEPNANSIVLRLDYGDFSMLLMGDAEEQTESRLLSRDRGSHRQANQDRASRIEVRDFRRFREAREARSGDHLRPALEPLWPPVAKRA